MAPHNSRSTHRSDLGPAPHFEIFPVCNNQMFVVLFLLNFLFFFIFLNNLKSSLDVTIRCQLSFFFFIYLERHPHVGIDVSNIFPCQLPLLVHLKIKTIRICFSGEFPKKNNYPLSFQPSLPFQPSTHCLQSVRTTTNPLALL